MTESIKKWVQDNPALIILILIQSIGLVIWGAKMDGRVDTLEKYGSPAVMEMKSKMAVIEARQNIVVDVLKENGRKMDELSNDLRRVLLPPKL